MHKEETSEDNIRVKFFKLVNGDNIITEVKKVYKGKMSIANPMIIAVDPDFEAGKQTIYMHTWMPQGIAVGNVCSLNVKDIIFSAEVENDIVEYYKGSILDLMDDTPTLKERKPNEYMDGDKKVIMFKDPKSNSNT